MIIQAELGLIQATWLQPHIVVTQNTVFSNQHEPFIKAYH